MGLNEHLSEMVEELSATLPGVTKKRMFGCDAFFANGTIYSLIWKDGRIGLKLLDEADYSALLAMPGAQTWTPGGKMVMSRWLLTPEAFHDDTDSLSGWVRKAHTQALLAPKKDAKAKKKKAPAAERPSVASQPSGVKTSKGAASKTTARVGRSRPANAAAKLSGSKMPKHAGKKAGARGGRSLPASAASKAAPSKRSKREATRSRAAGAASKTAASKAPKRAAAKAGARSNRSRPARSS